MKTIAEGQYLNPILGSQTEVIFKIKEELYRAEARVGPVGSNLILSVKVEKLTNDTVEEEMGSTE